MYEYFIFDLYGTLVDIRTNEGKTYLWKKMSEIYSSMGAFYSPMELKKEFRRLEEAEKESVRQSIGDMPEEEFSGEPDLTSVFSQLFQNKGVECGEQLAKMAAVTFRTLSRQKLAVFGGVKEALKELRSRGKKVYLLSNAQKDFTRPELALVGLTDCFDGILISSEEGCKKPSKAFFQRLIQRYQLQPEKCLMVGNDEQSDIKGAIGAGMDSLYIHTDISPELREESKATYCVLDGDWNKVAEILLRNA